MYCKKCGGKIESYASNCPFCGEALATNSVQATYTTSPGQEEKAHKGVGKWILTHIIIAIPLVGLIAILAWGFGAETKKDLTFRNWAKVQLVVRLLFIAAIVYLVVTFISVGTTWEEITNLFK